MRTGVTEKNTKRRRLRRVLTATLLLSLAALGLLLSNAFRPRSFSAADVRPLTTESPAEPTPTAAPKPTPVPAAREIPLRLELPPEQSAALTDGDCRTDRSFGGGAITVRAPEPVGALFLVWGSYPGEWVLEIGDRTSVEGRNGFLHELVVPDEPADTLTIRLPDAVTKLCDVIGYSTGTLPDEVQQWLPPCEEADLLLFSTHADDELVFFGGMIPLYAAVRGKEVQLVYMTTNYYDEGDYRLRAHEVLNGLWTAGARHYPVTNMEPDHLCEDLEEAEELYGTESFRAFQVEQLRRFRPLVAVTQDEEGEYGHGVHQLNARSLERAVAEAADASAFPESAERWGVWDTPKTYLHLYGPEEERTVLDYETPSEALGGRTPFEVAELAYEKHETQQKWDFEVYGFGSEYDSHSFGLFRSLVGPDEEKNDLLEHLDGFER